MPIPVEVAPNNRVPAWRRLGIKLDSEIPGTEAYRRIHEKHHSKTPSNSEGFQPSSFNKVASYLDTTSETDASPKHGKARKRKIDGPSSKNQDVQDVTPDQPEPSRKRKKSVTFTPDTKEIDGDSHQHLLNEWANEQNGSDGEFSKQEASEYLPAVKPNSEVAKPTESSKRNKSKTSKSKKVGKQRVDDSPHDQKPPFLDYVVLYQINRSAWKFNKGQQNKLLKSVFDVSRIPESYDYAVIPYLSGLQGESICGRLREEATQILNASPAEGAGNEPKDEKDEAQKRQRKRAEAVLLALSSDEARTARSSQLPSAPQEEKNGQPLHPNEKHGDGTPKKRRSRKLRTAQEDD